MDNDKFLTVADVATRIGISKQMVSYYHRQGELRYQPAGRRGRGELRLTSPQAVDEFLRRHPSLKKE